MSLPRHVSKNTTWIYQLHRLQLSKIFNNILIDLMYWKTEPHLTKVMGIEPAGLQPTCSLGHRGRRLDAPLPTRLPSRRSALSAAALGGHGWREPAGSGASACRGRGRPLERRSTVDCGSITAAARREPRRGRVRPLAGAWRTDSLPD